jgi:hypothetical protein
MNTIVDRKQKIFIVKGGVCKRRFRDGEFQEIYEKEIYWWGNPHTIFLK